MKLAENHHCLYFNLNKSQMPKYHF